MVVKVFTHHFNRCLPVCDAPSQHLALVCFFFFFPFPHGNCLNLARKVKLFLCSAFSAAVHYAIHVWGDEGDGQVDRQKTEAEMKTIKVT